MAQKDVTVHVSEPGTLKELLGEDWLSVSFLTLTGEINADDFLTLRTMNYRYLNYLDLSNSKITEGRIPDDAFYTLAINGVPVLQHIILPDVKEIGHNAFFCARLDEVVIPPSVTTIGKEAFCIYDGLPKITCEATIPPSAPDAFTSQQWESTILYVPKQSVQSYVEAPGWKNFENIIGIDITRVEDVSLHDTTVQSLPGIISICNGSNEPANYNAYSLTGIEVSNSTVAAGECVSVHVCPGVYIVNVEQKSFRIFVN
ncbi:MAG: leucine-rich repeat domain-containing protein [Prevotella sp.]|nr:leucine-rich repeat domain-containing protein [Prevotella sp.]MCM1074255.1 leucine-rich repeat domain-containing protein [Ruminococcus sp.]